MKLVFVSLFIGLAAAAVNKPHFRFPEVENKDKDDATKQREIDQLFVGLSKIDSSAQPVEFPFNDVRYYKNKEVLGKFMEAWKDGFIGKEEFFSLYHYKNRHDTYRIFDILFFARDYDTFIKIAKWAKNELHPLQYVYGLTAAIIHRKDLEGVHLPKLYQVVPHYYIPPEIIQGANKASILGHKERRFDMNNTGYEYSWYKGKTLESFKSGPKWNPYDAESRMSYFTEDVGLADFFAKTTMAYAPWISDEKYPTINSYRKGESLFHLYKHLLTKYNLERYANDLPPVKPLDFKFHIQTGYNPHLSTLNGRPFTPRPDGLIPSFSNPEGVHDLLVSKKRYDDVTDLLSYMNPMNDSYMNLEDNWYGLNRLGELVYGSTHPKIRNLYRPYHYQAFETLDDAVVASNAVHTTGSVLSNYLTEMRDPVYYRVLASVNQVFQNYFAKLPPYTTAELDFPGVKIIDFQTSHLSTYFENHVFDITNSVPLKSYQGYNYTVSKPRLAHKPFSFNVTIDSDKAQDVVIRAYITPSMDANNRQLSIAEKVQQAVPLFFYHADLKKGQHTLKGDSMHGFYPEDMNKIRSLPIIASGQKPGYSAKSTRCNFPSNLVIPKGGKPFSMFFVISPYDFPGDVPSSPCSWDLIFGLTQNIDFPTNRRVVPHSFEQVDNIMFKDITIDHYDSYTPDNAGSYEFV